MNNQRAATNARSVCVAALAGDVATLRELFNGGASVKATDLETAYRPLQLAARGGHVACLALILEQAGVDVNESVGRPFGTVIAGPRSRTSGGPQFGPMTALHLAAQCKRNTADLCRMLIDKGADINSTASFLQKTPLSLACEHADTEVIRLLVNEETFTRLNMSEPMKTVFPHTIAINSRNEAALDVILQFESQCSIKLNPSHQFKLVCEAAGPHTGERLFEKLYENYADTIATSANSTQILLAAIGNAVRVKYLLDKGCIPKVYHSYQCDVLLSLLTQATVSLPEDVLDLILGHITPSTVDLLNRDTTANNDHPLIMTYVDRTQATCFVRRYAKLLSLGLDPNRAIAQRASMVDHFVTLYADNGSVLMMTNIPFVFLTHHHNNVPTLHRQFTSSIRALSIHNNMPIRHIHRQFNGSFSALTLPIFTIFHEHTAVNIVPEMVRLLLNHGASPDASCQNELSPLLALVWRANRQSQNFQEGQPLREVFDQLVEAGVKLDECSDNSPFQSPDIAVAAACSGNEIVLQHCLENSDADSLILLGDLMKVEFTYHRINNTNEHTLRMRLRTNIGFSVRALLPFTDVRVTNLVHQLHDRFTDPIPANPVEYSINNEDRETTIWREVNELVNQTSPLKHMCRVSVRDLLIAGQRNLKAGIASLDLPTCILEYLKFQRK